MTLLVLLPLLIGAAGAILIIRRQRSRGGPEPTCGQCGYIVKGLTTFTCPECGSDLREVGIRRAAAGAGSLGRVVPVLKASKWLLSIWTALIVILALGSAMLVREHFWPHQRMAHSEMTAFPNSGAYGSVTIKSTVEAAARGQARARTVGAHVRYGAIELHQGPDQFLLAVNYLQNRHYYADAAGATVNIPGPPTDTSLLTFFKLHKIDTSNPAVQAEAKSLSALMTDAAKSPDLALAPTANFPFRVSRANFSGGVQPSGPLDMLPWLWPALWAAGIVLILLLMRRRLPAWDTATAAPSRPSMRTATIMYSDMVGFTAAAAGGPREAVLDLVRRHRELVQPTIKRRGGRIIKGVGDAFLILFDSATDAVLAGLEIQLALEQARPATFSADNQLKLRIAVSTGEVALHGDDVYGDPVNLASRVQQLAQAGQVLFTESTRATINKHEVRYGEFGAFELKGVDDKVPVYVALSPTGGPHHRPTPTPALPGEMA